MGADSSRTAVERHHTRAQQSQRWLWADRRDRHLLSEPRGPPGGDIKRSRGQMGLVWTPRV